MGNQPGRSLQYNDKSCYGEKQYHIKPAIYFSNLYFSIRSILQISSRSYFCSSLSKISYYRESTRSPQYNLIVTNQEISSLKLNSIFFPYFLTNTPETGVSPPFASHKVVVVVAFPGRYNTSSENYIRSNNT